MRNYACCLGAADSRDLNYTTASVVVADSAAKAAEAFVAGLDNDLEYRIAHRGGAEVLVWESVDAPTSSRLPPNPTHHIYVQVICSPLYWARVSE